MTSQKTLCIIRHGKSSWAFEGISDIDRPLSERGIRNAYTMADRLLRRERIPEYMLVSPATRALHTAIIFARVLGIPFHTIKLDKGIYTGDLPDLLALLTGLNDSFNHVFIFGHNPAFTILANHFLRAQVDNIPTAGVVELEFQTGSWKEIGRECLVSEGVDYPKKKE